MVMGRRREVVLVDSAGLDPDAVVRLRRQSPHLEPSPLKLRDELLMFAYGGLHQLGRFDGELDRRIADKFEDGDASVERCDELADLIRAFGHAEALEEFTGPGSALDWLEAWDAWYLDWLRHQVEQEGQPPAEVKPWSPDEKPKPLALWRRSSPEPRGVFYRCQKLMMQDAKKSLRASKTPHEPGESDNA
jgi:hypothetical protein